MPTPLTNLTRRLEALERDQAQARSLWRQMIREATQGSPPRLRLVETFQPDAEAYPSPPADTFWVRFIDATKPLWTPGEQGVTRTPRSAAEQVTAGTLDQRWILPDQVCTALRANRKWWIIDGPGLEHFGRIKSGLSKGATVAMDVLRFTGVKWVDTGYDMAVTDKFLNSGRTLAAKTKVQVRMEWPGRYFVVNALCDADDTPDASYEDA